MGRTRSTCACRCRLAADGATSCCLRGLERRTFNWRSFKRLFRPFLTLGQAIALALFLLMIVGSLFVVVYVGKRSAGLDVSPGIDMLNDSSGADAPLTGHHKLQSVAERQNRLAPDLHD